MGDEPAEPSPALACTWCSEIGPQVVPLVVGRSSRRRVVAAICPRCAEIGSTDRTATLLAVAFVVLAFASLWFWSIPGRPSTRATAVIAACWVGAVAAYGARAARAAWTARHDTGSALRSWRWAVPPLLGALVAVAVLRDLPLRARFALSRAAITSAADEALPGIGRHGRVRAYPAGLVQRADGTTGVLVDRRCGFFRPDPTDGGSAEDPVAGGAEVLLTRSVRLGGGWRAGCLAAPVDAGAPVG